MFQCLLLDYPVRLPFAFLALSVSFASACDPARPVKTDRASELPTVFDLVSVDGQSLPAPWRLSPEPRVVVRASIALPVWTPSVDNGSADWHFTLRSPDGTESEVRQTRSYFRREGAVGFDTCPPPFFCASILLPHSHAVLNGSLLEFPSENGHQALVYRQR
jgi:hypothetical protein